MKWSYDMPKMNGFYWLRRKDQKDTIVKIRDIEAQLVEFGAMIVWIGSDWNQSLCDVFKECTCQWWGPLYPPSI